MTREIQWPAMLLPQQRTVWIFLTVLVVLTLTLLLTNFFPVSHFLPQFTRTDWSNSSSHADEPDTTSFPDPFIVHYVLLHKHLNPDVQTSSLSYIECLSVLSVMKNLRPDFIYLHTNIPEFWPFRTCENLITNWTTVKLIPSSRKFTMNGRRILYIQHEADIRRLEVVAEFGGLALDFDVYVINGTELRSLLGRYPCVVCREDAPKLNAGFLACRKNAKYPRMLLERSYEQDYLPNEWVWNSGIVPFRWA